MESEPKMSSKKKLQKKLKLHANKVMALKAEMARIEEMKQSELKQWTAWYVMELRDLGTELYSTENALLRHQIEVCCFALIFWVKCWEFRIFGENVGNFGKSRNC